MKKCQIDNCFNPVFSHGYCQRHGYLRTDKKNMPVQARRIRLSDYSFGFEDQSTLFDWLWENAKDVCGRVFCEFTGEGLNQFYNTSLYYNCFAHVLPKGRYTYFKLNPANIKIVFPEFHRIIDQGSRDKRLEHPLWKWELWDAKVVEMKEQYLKYKQENKLP